MLLLPGGSFHALLPSAFQLLLFPLVAPLLLLYCVWRRPPLTYSQILAAFPRRDPESAPAVVAPSLGPHCLLLLRPSLTSLPEGGAYGGNGFLGVGRRFGQACLGSTREVASLVFVSTKRGFRRFQTLEGFIKCEEQSAGLGRLEPRKLQAIPRKKRGGAWLPRWHTQRATARRRHFFGRWFGFRQCASRTSFILRLRESATSL